MRRFLFSTFLFTVSFFAKSQIKWDGEGDGVSWNDATNWVGNVVPISTDNVLLDNSVVGGSYTVDLPTGVVNVTVSTLTITPSGANIITLNLPSLNTNDPGLTVTGAGDALVLNSGAILRNSSGAAAGSGITITNTFRINDGGHYIHNTTRGNAAIVSQLSTAAGTELGVFEFDVPSASGYIISTSSSTVYGTLELSADEAGGTKTYTSNAGGTLTVNGDFLINGGVSYLYTPPAAGITFLVNDDCTINSTATFNLCNSGSNTMTFKVGGDLTLNGTLTETGTTTTTTLELNGTTNQQISGTGSIQNSITLVMNNSAGATLNVPLTLPYNLTLTSGNLTTTGTNLLTMVDGAIYTGGSTSSFIDGPMKKIGDDNFTFPVGKGSIYAPIGISGTGGLATDEFTAEYIRANPQSAYGTNYAAGINHISYVEYWTLERNVGTASKFVALDVHQTSFCLVPATTFVSRYDNVAMQWTNEPSTPSGFAACGSYMCGTITTNAAITSFSPFTLATSDPFAINPLPIKLIGFRADKINSGTAHISWELAECCSKNARFEIQKSADGRNFSTAYTAQGNELSRYYYQNDARLAKGTTWYRLKMTDADGSVSYSKIVAIINDSKGLLITSVSPNPVQQNAVISLTAAKEGVAYLTVHDLTGRIVISREMAVTEGSNNIQLPAHTLPAGVYHISAVQEGAKTVLRFIKQ
jgi:hypothetical protein